MGQFYGGQKELIMVANNIKAEDYLFMKYRTLTPNLIDVAKDYYPHLSKFDVLRKANQQEFPFTVFKIDKSKRAPFMVHITELAKILDEEYQKASEDHVSLHQ
jgi:hypothetical protein